MLVMFRMILFMFRKFDAAVCKKSRNYLVEDFMELVPIERSLNPHLSVNYLSPIMYLPAIYFNYANFMLTLLDNLIPGKQPNLNSKR